MIARAMIGILLCVAIAASAQAQNFDGTYKGTITVTKRVDPRGLNTECPKVGGRLLMTIKVRGEAVALVNPFATYPGTADTAGTLEVRGSRLTRSGVGRVAATYSGTIRGRVAAGSTHAIGPAGECYATFKARKIMLGSAKLVVKLLT